MKRSESEFFSTRVVEYYENIAGCNERKTVHHFLAEGKRRTTIYAIINRYLATNPTKYRKLKGRPVSQATPRNVQRIKSNFTKNPSISVRILARKLYISKSTICQIKLHKLGIKAYAKQAAPKYVKDQEVRAKTGCHKIYKKGLRKILVLDDETYVSFDPKDVPGKKYYHATKSKDVDYKHKVKPKAKFPKRHLVWQAIDANGNVSTPYFCEGTINANVYLNECIKKRLIPFIKQYHEIEDVIFWPDMATSHYADKVTQYLEEINIDFVNKKENAPNVPQARFIEKFWAVCKREYSKRKDPPKTEKGFRRIWGRITKEVRKNSAKAVMDHAWKELRKIGYKGIGTN